MVRRFLAGAAMVLVACGGTSSDAANAGGDGGGGAFCGGKLAGTCAESVFVAAAACFNPSGACTADTRAATNQEISTTTYCWPSGAKEQVSSSPSGTDATTTWLSSTGAKCTIAAYDAPTNVFHCPDGTTAIVHPEACPELAAFFTAPTCTAGACP